MAYRPDLNEEIAQLVRSAIKAKDTSIAATADKAGIPERTLRRRMSGKAAWTTDELDAVADALEVDIAVLWPKAVA